MNSISGSPQRAYDVIVVGAGGGMSACALTQAGLNVLMLEVDRDYHPETEAELRPFELPGSLA